MSEHVPEKQYPLTQSAGFAVSTATVAGLIDVLAHLGPTGLLVSGLAGYVAWKHGPELYEQVRELLPHHPALAASTGDASGEEELHRHTSQSARSFWDRAFGLPSEARPRSGDEDGEKPTDEDDECLVLGMRLRPHADTIFSNRIVILGMPGAGKSNLVAVLAEEVGQFDAPLIIFDRKPEYGPLCEEPYVTRPYRASARNLTPETAPAFGQRVMRERLQVVVDLASYKHDVTAALVMLTLVESVSAWQEALPNEQRLPCTFVLEEAHYWLPESEGLSTIRGVKSRKTGESLLARLQRTFFSLANLGRSLGMGLIVSTQRPANVDKRLIAVAEWRFLLKAMEPADLKVYRGFGLESEQAMRLDPKAGEAFVIGPQMQSIHRIRRRYSPDEAQTPGLSNIKNTRMREQIAQQHYSPFPSSRTKGDAAHVNPEVNGSPVKSEYGVNAPQKPVNTPVNTGEYSPEAVNAGEHAPKMENRQVNAPQKPVNDGPDYSPAEEVQVVLAYAELSRAGKPLTRTGIRDYLRWNNKQYERVIKPVCDKHHLAE